MKFFFKAKSLLGDMREGHIEAVSKDAAVAVLQSKGLVPLVVEQEKKVPEIMEDFQRIWEGVNLRETAVFFRQIATLIEAKVSIVSSMRAVAEQTENTYLRTVIWDMVDDVEDGTPLSEAMAKRNDVFEPLAVSMVKAGELSGNLERSIAFLADNAEKNYDLTSKIKSALFYPIFVLSASLVIGFIVFTTVLPKLMEIFKDLKAEIPWYTKALMSAGDFMSQYWWLVLILLATVITSVVLYMRTEDGKREWDIIKMKIPVIGNIFKYVYLARFSENLAVLLSGGIPIVKALTIVGSVVGSTAYESSILRAADEVKKGGTMSSVFARSSYFPPIVSQMIKIGEDSGKISEVLKHISVFYGQETDRITRNLSTMLEPILICFLGLGVAALVFAILVPIYNLSNMMG